MQHCICIYISHVLLFAQRLEELQKEYDERCERLEEEYKGMLSVVSNSGCESSPSPVKHTAFTPETSTSTTTPTTVTTTAAADDVATTDTNGGGEGQGQDKEGQGHINERTEDTLL